MLAVWVPVKLAQAQGAEIRSLFTSSVFGDNRAKRRTMRSAAIDLGKVRVGLAVSDELGLLAHARRHLDGHNPGQLVERAGSTGQCREHQNIHRRSTKALGRCGRRAGSSRAGIRQAAAAAHAMPSHLDGRTLYDQAGGTTIACNGTRCAPPAKYH